MACFCRLPPPPWQEAWSMCQWEGWPALPPALATSKSFCWWMATFHPFTGMMNLAFWEAPYCIHNASRNWCTSHVVKECILSACRDISLEMSRVFHLYSLFCYFQIHHLWLECPWIIRQCFGSLHKTRPAFVNDKAMRCYLKVWNGGHAIVQELSDVSMVFNALT